MKEADYIAATNLARLRIASDTLRMVTTESAKEVEVLTEIQRQLQAWMSRMEKRCVK